MSDHLSPFECTIGRTVWYAPHLHGKRYRARVAQMPIVTNERDQQWTVLLHEVDPAYGLECHGNAERTYVKAAAIECVFATDGLDVPAPAPPVFDLESLEVHACSSGTSTQPLVRQQILMACQEIRMLRATRVGFHFGSPTWPGISKLMEEAGEVVQVCAKLIAVDGDVATPHWDGTPLDARLNEEIGDLLGAIRFVMEHCENLDKFAIFKRSVEKLEVFERWHRGES